MKRPPALLCGVPIADVTMDETLDLLADLAADGRRTGRSHQIATVNVDFLVNAIDNPEVAGLLRGADVCLADGMPIVWGSRWLGMPIAERVAGSDLVPLLVDTSRTRGWHIYVFGSAPDVADNARTLLAERFPGARFTIDPGPMIDDVEQIDDDVLDAIAAAEPDILCVALGNPKQERFIAAHRDRLGAPVLIGVGGSLDMLVGKRKRAPRWMQRIGLEWVARALQEPFRLGPRYAHDIRVFGPALARQWRAARRHRRGPVLSLTVTPTIVTGRFDTDVGVAHTGTAGADWSAAYDAIRAGADLDVDVRHDRPPRVAAVSALVGLVACARHSGVPVSWQPVPENVLRSATLDGMPATMIGAPVRRETDHAP